MTDKALRQLAVELAIASRIDPEKVVSLAEQFFAFIKGQA